MEFEFFIREGKVIKRHPDIQLARALLESSADRLKNAIEDVMRKPKYAFEDAYDAVVELIDGLLAVKGYKSYSHEAKSGSW
jgi:hypothetical protein